MLHGGLRFGVAGAALPEEADRDSLLDQSIRVFHAGTVPTGEVHHARESARGERHLRQIPGAARGHPTSRRGRNRIARCSPNTSHRATRRSKSQPTSSAGWSLRRPARDSSPSWRSSRPESATAAPRGLRPTTFLPSWTSARPRFPARTSCRAWSSRRAAEFARIQHVHRLVGSAASRGRRILGHFAPRPIPRMLPLD